MTRSGTWDTKRTDIHWNSLVTDYVSLTDTSPQTLTSTIVVGAGGDVTGTISATAGGIAGDVDAIVVGSNTLSDTITFVEGDSIFLSVSGQSITITNDAPYPGSVDWSDVYNEPSTYAPSTHRVSHETGGSDTLNIANIGGVATDSQIPDIDTLSGTITDIQHGTLTGSTFHNWEDVGNKPYIVNEIVVGSSTLEGTITLVEGSNTTISVSGQSITFSSDAGGGTTTWVRKAGDTPLSGTIDFAEGSNITLTQTGQSITIAYTLQTTGGTTTVSNQSN